MPSAGTQACFVVGGLALGFVMIALLLRNRILRDWVELDNAVVLETRWEGSPIRLWLVIDYEYHSSDVHYVGCHRRLLLPLVPPPLAERIAERYRPGTLVSVWVNPDDHQVSVLEPTPPGWMIGVGLFIAGFSFWLGSLYLV